MTIMAFLYFVWLQDKQQHGEGWEWVRGEENDPFPYLLSCPGPSPLRMTECHRLRRAMSHSQSFDFPEPDSWWTACLWECPRRMLEEGKMAFILPLMQCSHKFICNVMFEMKCISCCVCYNNKPLFYFIQRLTFQWSHVKANFIFNKHQHIQFKEEL